jgi:hypothetical protein
MGKETQTDVAYSLSDDLADSIVNPQFPPKFVFHRQLGHPSGACTSCHLYAAVNASLESLRHPVVDWALLLGGSFF